MKKWIASATTLLCCVLVLVLFWPHVTSAQRQTLNLYIWSEYIDPDILTAFEKATNSRVLVSVYESNEDMVAKLRGGEAPASTTLLFPPTTLCPTCWSWDCCSLSTKN